LAIAQEWLLSRKKYVKKTRISRTGAAKKGRVVLLCCDGEQKTNMPRRDRKETQKPLTRDELSTLEERLQGFADNTLVNYYKASHRMCEFRERIPTPSAIQELVSTVV
jgi:hypothetical protein